MGARRLSDLQEEKQIFFDEGIYDIVNTMCRGDMLGGSSGRAKKVDITEAEQHTKVIATDQAEAMKNIAKAQHDLEATSRDLAALLAMASAGGCGEGGALEVFALRLRLREAEA